MADDGKGGKSGWTDRELLVCLLNVVEKSDVTLNFKAGAYPLGRNANGFRQKINHLKNAFKPEWDAMAAGQPMSGDANTTKKPTQQKRKAKNSDNANGDAGGSPKKRGRPKKKVDSEEPEEPTVKDEVSGDDDSIDAAI